MCGRRTVNRGSVIPAMWVTLSEIRSAKEATRMMDCRWSRMSSSEARKTDAAKVPIMETSRARLQFEPAAGDLLRGKPSGTACTAGREGYGQSPIGYDAGDCVGERVDVSRGYQ